MRVLEKIPTCTIACEPIGAKAGGLIYEKDVFERLSLWSVNFTNSNNMRRPTATGWAEETGTCAFFPVGAKGNYEAHKVWSKFTNIVEGKPTFKEAKVTYEKLADADHSGQGPRPT